MTVQEALEYFKNCTVQQGSVEEVCKVSQIVNIAIEALEKQVEYENVRRKIENINPVDFGSIFSYASHQGAKEMKKEILNILDDWSEVE